MANFCVLSNYVNPVLLKTDGASCNCSLFDYHDKSYIVSRSVSYTKCGKHSFLYKGRCHTTNYLYSMDKSYNLQKLKVLSSPHYECLYYKYNGLEDIRVIKWAGSLYFLGTRVLGDSDKGTMCFGRLVNLELCDITEVPTTQLREKNWMPIESMPFCCIYSMRPYKLINVKSREFMELAGGLPDNFSGSSPIVPYKDGLFISVVHKRNSNNDYLHYFVVYNSDLSIKTISQPFSFFGSKIEFCVTLKVLPKGVLLLPSVNDGLSYAFEIPDYMVQRIVDGAMGDATCDPCVYDRFYADAKSINAPEVAASMAVMATNPKYISEAIIYNHTKSSYSIGERAHRQKLLLSNFYKYVKR